MEEEEEERPRRITRTSSEVVGVVEAEMMELLRGKLPPQDRGETAATEKGRQANSAAAAAVGPITQARIKVELRRAMEEMALPTIAPVLRSYMRAAAAVEAPSIGPLPQALVVMAEEGMGVMPQTVLQEPTD